MADSCVVVPVIIGCVDYLAIPKKNVHVQTLTNAWDKLNYLPEIKSEIELGEKLMNYYQVETC